MPAEEQVTGQLRQSRQGRWDYRINFNELIRHGCPATIHHNKKSNSKGGALPCAASQEGPLRSSATARFATPRDPARSAYVHAVDSTAPASTASHGAHHTPIARTAGRAGSSLIDACCA